MKGYDKIQKWIFLTEPFSQVSTPSSFSSPLLSLSPPPHVWQENELLTAKMSLRRNNIIKFYAGLIEEIYQEKEGFTISYGNEGKEKK